MTDKTRNKKTLIGLVASDKMTKTVVVEVTRRMEHAVYKKYIQRRTRYKAHDETNECREGDRVLIEECRPYSKDKRWRVKQILDRAV
ncbi:MAG: 30S ribosomal protein S17 [Deltaproteobacteria bacterium]|nr:MAG: 30S ribosomal protein S17 [Deltaproteobacteria bacterium]